ncbi:helix-turn-helix domain-containing protein [Rhodoferax fermentans]|nr:helix-turn-helix transcriptional regulator [Rhodoferax fermentans]
MVTNHQDEFIPQLGQGTDLHAVTGATQQFEGVIGQTLMGVLGPFEGSKAHVPAGFLFHFKARQLSSLPVLSDLGEAKMPHGRLGHRPNLISIIVNMQMQMPTPTGDELKAARVKVGLSQVQAAVLMGYPVQSGSRGGQQSRTWQALESSQDPRKMPGPIFAMFQLLTDSHPEFSLVKKESPAETSAS